MGKFPDAGNDWRHEDPLEKGMATQYNLRYADDTTLMAESDKELKSLLMKVKEEREKACLKCHIQKTKIMAPGPITHSK